MQGIHNTHRINTHQINLGGTQPSIPHVNPFRQLIWWIKVPAYRSITQILDRQYIIPKLQLPSWFYQVGFLLHHKILCTLGMAQAYFGSEPTGLDLFGTSIGAYPIGLILPPGLCPQNNTLQMPRPATETVEFYLIVLMLTYYPQSQSQPPSAMHSTYFHGTQEFAYGIVQIYTAI